jgi:hypothetical protein
MAKGNILQPFGKCLVILAYFVVIWYIFPVLVRSTKNNLATLDGPPPKDEKTKSRKIFPFGGPAHFST